jgi:dipeptidase
MCDTFVALSDATADGSVILGKNSDREPNEAHEVVLVPAASHRARDTVRCTYIEVPQVPHTHAVLLAKPYWIWGAEMGANEHGVVIGNEAVFTKVPHEEQDSLYRDGPAAAGPRRRTSASEAVDAIVALLAVHGQVGGAGTRRICATTTAFSSPTRTRHGCWRQPAGSGPPSP